MLPLIMNPDSSSASPCPPGDFIRAELEQRGWSQVDLANIIRRPLPTINEIIQGKRAIMPEMAVGLGVAFGTGPEIWMQREAEYRLSLVAQDDPAIQRRARLYELAPIKEMQRRGWIQPTDDTEEIEAELCVFFGVLTLDEEPQLQAVARQTFKADEFTAAQRAWALQAGRLASVLNAKPFDEETFVTGLARIHSLADVPEKVRHIPRLLAEIGVRFVIVEPLPRSRIDGAAFWLSETEPVIVMSLRYDRIDWFWHTLAHELSHIKNGDKRSIDSNLVGETRAKGFDDMERKADIEGANWLIPEDALRSFIARVRPFYSKERINQFASRMRVHPGIVSGQLQHRHEIGWKANREMLVKVRHLITPAAMTDGWGRTPFTKLNKHH
jgi:HTH-type transcriptional regulator / antitoxin HigA